jgi:GNAT superfamily N-acetyltransferase
MHIRRYSPADEEILIQMLTEEGGEWSDYYSAEGRVKYLCAVKACATYLLFDQDELCGYARCHADYGFGVYVHDLLVRKKHRGHGYGRLLLEQACRDFPGQTAYVLSDADPYYEKLGYANIGTIFTVKPPQA